MYLDATVLTAGALRLLQLLLNPFVMAGLQSAASPSNGLPFAPPAPSAPPRQIGSAAELLSQLGVLPGLAPGLAPGMGPVPSGTLAPGSMTVASMPMAPLPYAPWLFAQPLPAVATAPSGPAFVPASAVAGLLPAAAAQDGQASPSAAALVALEEAVAPYLPSSASAPATAGSAGSAAPSTHDTAAPMPLASLLSLLSGLASGVRVVVVHFAASMAVMGVAQLVRIVVENLPIILRLLGLSRDSVARVVVQGVMRAQCLQRAACVLGRHAATYPAAPEVLRWLRSPDPSAAVAPEHPVWAAFRSAAEGTSALCDAYAC